MVELLLRCFITSVDKWYLLYCIQTFYSASHSIKPYRSALRKQTGLRGAREVDKLEERMVLREACGRGFHRVGPIIVKDLSLTIVVLAQRTKR